MTIKFYKYHGTGNDFVLVDNRELTFPKDNHKLIYDMCSRRFGIGADGLILLENDASVDFKMVYYNSDGHQSTMCGNGGRCIVKFAKDIGHFTSSECTFEAPDGLHTAVVSDEVVKLEMRPVTQIETRNQDYYLHTGSPHYVQFVEEVENFDVVNEGKSIRYNDEFKKEGTNVNFVEIADDYISVATYERGVEDETYSCGTGVTASALATHVAGKGQSPQAIKTKGGDLKVYYTKEGSVYNDIFLEGPAIKVFEGEWKV